MKRLASLVPHLIITAYITTLSAIPLPAGLLVGASAVGLLSMGLLAFAARRGGISPVIVAYLVFFAANVLGYAVLPQAPGRVLSTHATAALYAVFFAVVAGPALIARRYFTEYFARKTTSAEVQQTEIYRRINRNMSWAWAVIFAASAGIALLPDALHLGVAALFVQLGAPAILIAGVGPQFNKRYPAYYQRKRGLSPAPHAETGQREVREEKAMSKKLRVVALNGSPHVGVGNTSTMIEMMRPMLAQDGVELEQAFLAERKINHCVGCGVCLEKGRCWQRDDHTKTVQELLDADAIILASPVYFGHVTSLMKAFIDRSLAFGHKPRTAWKPGMAVSVSAGSGETATADYLAGVLRVYGAFPIGTLTAMGTQPGELLGRDLIEARGQDLAADLSRAIREKRRYPATDRDLAFYNFMGSLVKRQKDFMRDDYRHWQETGMFNGFEGYVGQAFEKAPFDPGMRREWIRQLISEGSRQTRSEAPVRAARAVSATAISNCQELLRSMPLGFDSRAAGGLSAVYQFEINGTERFDGYLDISAGRCRYVDGIHPRPDVRIKAPADVWLAISRGEMDGQGAFMSGKYKVEGNLGLLMKLGTFMGPTSPGSRG